jgi:hypothetical protein
VLSYWLGRERSYLWVIGRGGASAFALPGQARIAELVNRYSAEVEHGRDPLERDNPAGRELFKMLIAPRAP